MLSVKTFQLLASTKPIDTSEPFMTSRFNPRRMVASRIVVVLPLAFQIPSFVILYLSPFLCEASFIVISASSAQFAAFRGVRCTLVYDASGRSVTLSNQLLWFRIYFG